MGRPSVAPVRRAQIIEAASRCIARRGLSGTTLELIADESGLSRSHIRHYLGNRDRIIDAVWDATIEPYLAACRANHAALGRITVDAATEAAMDFFFGERMLDTADLPLFNAVLNGGLQDDRVRRYVEAAYREMFDYLVDTLRTVAPGAEPEEVERAAFAVHAMAMGTSAAGRMRLFDHLRPTARLSAEAVIAQVRMASDRPPSRCGR